MWDKSIERGNETLHRPLDTRERRKGPVPRPMGDSHRLLGISQPNTPLEVLFFVPSACITICLAGKTGGKNVGTPYGVGVLIYRRRDIVSSSRDRSHAPLLLSSDHAFRLPVQAAHDWREQCSHPSQDACDPRKANNYIRRKILEKESAYHSSQWSRGSGQGQTYPKNLPVQGGLDQSL
jgi:hypothetical protein